MTVNRNEARTRKDLIDPQLQKAGWIINDTQQVIEEMPLHEHDAEQWEGFTDYSLLRDNGEVLAIVEAKREDIDSSLAQQQVEYYLKKIKEDQDFYPFAFMADGRRIYFYDIETGSKRRIFGFFSKNDLERMLHIRRHKEPLAGQTINFAITNRDYQIEAIKRVSRAFDDEQRKALLVMATGTGKTRTAMSLIDVFLKANQARKVLFVADRDALVAQALHEGFEQHLAEPATRLYGISFDEVRPERLYVATLQTLSNHFRKLTPAFFDLVVFDEVHRSIFNKWREVLEYFDAQMVGLTATPASYIDRNTFIEFGCYDGKPTFLYTYDEAVKDGYLVNYSLYRAETHFQKDGIKAIQLSEDERNALIELGHDPDDINFEGTDLEKVVSNKDTLRKQWQEILDHSLWDEAGEMIGKTIVFVMTQEHALRLEEVFQEMNPQWANWARVITYKSEYKGQLVNNFKKDELPRIAISVNMLETGVNVPEVVNLVFMRPVQSPISLMQMIGRGTRNNETCTFHHRLPNGEKTEFRIIDFWENDFNKTAEEASTQSLPVAVSIFNTRLKLLTNFLNDQPSETCQRVIADLRGQIAEIPLDSFSVEKVLSDVVGIREVWDDHFWEYLTSAKINLLRMNIAPLLRYTAGIDLAATTFTHKIERMKLQVVEQKDSSAIIETIRDDVTRLPQFVRDTDDKNDAIRFVLSKKINTATIDELTTLIDTLAESMRKRSKRPNPMLLLDLEDYIASSGYVTIVSTGEEVYVSEYRERVEKHILDMVNQHPTIQHIQNGENVDDWQLIELERTLRQELTSLEINKNLRQTYGSEVVSLLSLLRQLLELDTELVPDYATIIHRQFDTYIENHHPAYNDDQIRFLRVVKNIFVQRGQLTADDLYDSPALKAFGNYAVERLFNETQVNELLELANTLSA